MNLNARTPPLLLVPPPLMFLVTFLAAIGLQHQFPIVARQDGLVKACQVAGAAVLACGIAITLASVRSFASARTTLKPFGAASKLLTRGPYRFTRNPMYLSLVLAYMGVAGLMLEWWAVPLLVVPFCAINFVVIPFEESRLRQVFGAEFEAYCAQVRRWL